MVNIERNIMKLYNWGFDKAGYDHPECAEKFLNRNGFIQVSHGWDPTYKDNVGAPLEQTFTYINPAGVIMVTDHSHEQGDGFWYYVGLSSFNKQALIAVVNDLKNNPIYYGGGNYVMFYEAESPNARDFI